MGRHCRIINDVDTARRTSKIFTAAKAYVDLTVASTPYTPDGRIVAHEAGKQTSFPPLGDPLLPTTLTART